MRSVIRYGFDDRTAEAAERTRDWLQDEVFLLEITPRDGETLSGVLETVSVGRITLARHTNRTAAIRRRSANGYSPNPIGSDGFQLAFHTAGAARLMQRGRAVELAAGDAALVYGGDAFEGDFERGAGDNQIVAAILPADLALSLHPQAADRTLRRIEGRAPALALFQAYARAVLDAPPLGVVAALAESHLGDLWRATLEDPGLAAPDPTPGIEAARAAAALRLIARRYADPGLSLDSLARAMAISPRVVQRALAAEGTSFRDALNAQRLQRAADLLRAASWAGARIVDVAYASGFSDLSHFNRAFRARFGMPPGAYRAS